MENGLTITEAAKLENLEEVISNGQHAFILVGNALGQIQEERLYRATHKTFDEYVRERWSMSGRHAYRQIEAAAITEDLRPIGHTPEWKPTSESQVRALGTVGKEDREKVLSAAIEQHGPSPTAVQIQEAAKAIVDNDPAPPPPTTTVHTKKEFEPEETKDMKFERTFESWLNNTTKDWSLSEGATMEAIVRKVVKRRRENMHN